MDFTMYRFAKPEKIIKTKTTNEKRTPAKKSKSNVPLLETELSPLMAHHIMRQPDGKVGGKDIFKTFNEWATILDVPPDYNQHIAEGFTTGAIPLPKFKDVLAMYFSAQRKVKDADKIFPRQSRIDAIKENLRNGGSTPAPDNYNVGNAQWKFHNKTNFQFHPNDGLWLEAGATPYLFQLQEQLYAPMPVTEQDYVKNQWKKQPIPYEIWLQAPVTSIEDSYKHYLEAHIYWKFDKHQWFWAHRGRDETFEQLKIGISSSFSKALVAKFNEMCPACKKRVETSSEIGKKREAKKRKGEQEGQEVVPTKKPRNENIAHPPKTQIQSQEFPETSLQVDTHHQQNQPVPPYVIRGGLTMPYIPPQPQQASVPTINNGLNRPVQDQPVRSYKTVGELIFPSTGKFPQDPVPTTSTSNQSQYQPQSHISGTTITEAAHTVQDPAVTANQQTDLIIDSRPDSRPGTYSYKYVTVGSPHNDAFSDRGTQNDHPTLLDDSNIDPNLDPRNPDIPQYTGLSVEDMVLYGVRAFNRSTPDAAYTSPPTVDNKPYADAEPMEQQHFDYTQYTPFNFPDESFVPSTMMSYHRTDPSANGPTATQMYSQYLGPNENLSVPQFDCAAPKQSFEASTAGPDSSWLSSDPEQDDLSQMLPNLENTYSNMDFDIDNVDSIFEDFYKETKYAADHSLP